MKIILEYKPIIEGYGRTCFIEKIYNNTKIHTIRSLKYRGVEYPIVARHTYVGNTDQNKDVLTDIKGIEEIEIIHLEEKSDAFKLYGYSPLLVVDGCQLNQQEALELAMNDGFVSWHEFKQWFDSDASKLILHFTDRRYGVK